MSDAMQVDEADFLASPAMLLDRLRPGGRDRIEMMRAGRVVAVVTAPAEAARVSAAPDIYGFMRGSVVIPMGLDLTSPSLDAFLAEEQDGFEA
jgi:hypothetical protein